MINRDVIMQDAVGETANGTAIDVKGLSHLSMQVTGTFSGTVTFEATVDASNWASVQVYNIATGAVSTTATAAGIYTCGVSGLYQIRARVSGWVSGTITVTGLAVNVSANPYATLPLAANSGVDIGDVDILTINSVAPQFDDTDKVAVSLYGKETAAGDTALVASKHGELVSVSARHWHQHEGDMFTAHIDNTVTNIGEMTVIAFNTPAAGEIHVWFQATSTHTADLYLYENTSIDVDEGTDLTVLNRNRSVPMPTSLLSTIETTPEVGKVTSYNEGQAATANITTTTELDHAPIIGGAGPKALGGVADEAFGYILAASQQYAVMMVAGTNDDATHHLKVLWIEG